MIPSQQCTASEWAIWYNTFEVAMDVMLKSVIIIQEPRIDIMRSDLTANNNSDVW